MNMESYGKYKTSGKFSELQDRVAKISKLIAFESGPKFHWTSKIVHISIYISFQKVRNVTNFDKLKSQL